MIDSPVRTVARGVLVALVVVGACLAVAADPDADGDGVPDATDCAPFSPGLSQPPGEVGDLRADKVAEGGTEVLLRWTRAVQGPTSDVYRGTIVPGQPWTDASCLPAAELPGTSKLDVDVPFPGEAFYYLIAARNACGESPAGRRGDGTPVVPVPACPTLGADTDQDSVADLADNCVSVANPGLEDADDDFVGDACEPATVAIKVLSQDIRSDFPTWAQHRQQPVSRLGFRNSGRYRSLGWIDLSSIPASAVIDDAVIVYWTTSGDPANVDPNGDVPNLGGPITVEVRRILRAWNFDEPLTYPPSLTDNDTPAVAGETSWNSSLHPQTWEQPGVSGPTDVGPVLGGGTVTSAIDTRFDFTGPGLVGLVQSWLDAPATNYGFLLKAIAADEAGASANRKILCGKGFPLETSTGLDPATAQSHRPEVRITYHVP